MLPFSMFRYVIRHYSHCVYCNVMKTKIINFNSSSNCVYKAVVMTKIIKINSSTTFITLRT